MSFGPAPEPASELGRYRILSPTAGVRVSPLCLGAMSIGEAWKEGMGHMDKKSSFQLLDEFVALGGNFIDTANNYQGEESELWIGEWMKERGNRDELVLATKYTTWYKQDAKNRVNYSGNTAKSLHLSVNASLKKLQTDYIDLLYLHWWEYTTSIEEVMQSLNHLVKAGKVLYLGISDTPAWVVSKANQYARDHGLAQFSVYQGRWSVALRDLEREIIPMCLSERMGICPWGALGSGKFQSKADLEKRKAAGESLRSITGSADQTEHDVQISAALEKVGKEVGTSSVTAVAIAYVMHKTPYVFPIIGGRKVEHLRANVEALSIKLTPQHIAELEEVTKGFDPGFPHTMIGPDIQIKGEPNFLMAMAGHYSFVSRPEPISGAGSKQ